MFFLGGLTDPTVTDPIKKVAVGFSKNPAQPFSLLGNNRVKPFFEFVSSRFCDKDNDGMPEYVDTLSRQTSPYLYFDSNNGQSYLTWTSAAPQSQLCNIDCFYDGFTSQATLSSDRTWLNGNWMQLCYYTNSTPPVPYMQKKYQIVSPGYSGIGAASPDRAYGIGGQFDPANANSLYGEPGGDNITNFQSGTLSGE